MIARRCYFTVATSNYIASVCALHRQIVSFEPRAQFFALIVDRPTRGDGFTKLGFPSHFLEEHVDPQWFQRATFFYDAFELVNCAKATGHLIAWKNYQAEEWAYVDGDIVLLGALDALWQTQGDIVLTPHRTQPSAEISDRGELLLLKHGAINAGILACRRSPKVEAFLRWYESVLRFNCFSEWKGQFVDQKWLDLVPSLFPDTGLCRHSGINVGYWNCRQRLLRRDIDGVVRTNGVPVLALHLSKWRPTNPGVLPIPRDLPGYDIWAELAHTYYTLLSEFSWQAYRKQHYRYSTDSKGRSLLREMRRGYFLARDRWEDPWTASRPSHIAAGLSYCIREEQNSLLAVARFLRGVLS